MWDPLRNEPRKRISECLCVFLERLLCDPMGTGTCFDEGIVGDFSFCCLTTAILDLVADLFAGLFELTLNFYSTDAIFRFIDRNAYLFFLKKNIVSIIDCIFSVFSLIPEVGPCLRVIFVRAFALVVCIIEIAIRYVIALFTLPYFVLFDESSFVLDPARGAQEEWETILDGFGDPENPTSFVNCICFVLNWGVPIPPIPCMECEPQGFIVPPPDIEIDFAPPGSFESIMQLVKDDPSFAFYGRLHGLKRLTPIRRYDGETANPWELKDMIMRNAQFMGGVVERGLKDIDRKAAETKRLLKERSALTTTIYHPHTVTVDGELRDEFQHDSNRTAAAAAKSVQSGLSPTKPPLTGCTPTPACFDLCGIPRSLAELLSFALAWFGRIWTAFIQSGTEGFDYFTDGGLEQDVTLAIRLLLEPVVAACDLLNLVIPVTQFAARPDFCCFFVRLADLTACILQTIVNAIKSLALGSNETPVKFTYFKEGDFEKDLDVSFTLTLDLVVCACNLIRAVLPFLESNGFDVCCFPEVVAAVAIEITRGIIFTILNLALLGTDKGREYFQLADPLNDSLDELPIVVRADAIINALFGTSIPALTQAQQNFADNDSGAFAPLDEAEPVCGQPQGGIPFCICNFLDTLIPARPEPLQPVSDTNCPYVRFFLSFFLHSRPPSSSNLQ